MHAERLDGVQVAPPINRWSSHWLEVPVHRSSASQGVCGVRHTTPACANPSAGHEGAVPVQCSSTSHPPSVCPRQTLVAGLKRSAGQEAVAPSQRSSTSHSPAATRHTEPCANASAGQSADTPEQDSATSQGPPTSRQIPVRYASSGQKPSGPHVSSTSHGPRAVRHVFPAVHVSRGSTHTDDTHTVRGAQSAFTLHVWTLEPHPSADSARQTITDRDSTGMPSSSSRLLRRYCTHAFRAVGQSLQSSSHSVHRRRQRGLSTSRTCRCTSGEPQPR